MPPKYGSYKTVWERHKKMEYQRCMEKYYEFPGVTWIYFWIDNKIDDLSVDSSTVAAKKGGNK